MSTTFAAFFLSHADCLSPAEKAQALQGAACALQENPALPRSYWERQRLLAQGQMQQDPGDAPEFTAAWRNAAQSWVNAVESGEPGILSVARELSDAAIGYAESAGLCTGCLREQDRCECAGTAEVTP